MKFMTKALLASAALLALAPSVFAANGSWSPIYTDKTNRVYINAISLTTTTGAVATPPLPLNFQGSRVTYTMVPVSSTISGTAWATIGGPIGVSTSVAGNSATITSGAVVSGNAGGSTSTVTTANQYHDVGFTVSGTAAGVLVNVRVIENKPLTISY